MAVTARPVLKDLPVQMDAMVETVKMDSQVQPVLLDQPELTAKTAHRGLLDQPGLTADQMRQRH